MKKLLLRSILFIGSYAIISFFFYLINSYIIDKQAIKYSKSTTTLACGDSHVVCGIDPYFVKNSVNVSQLGETYLMTFYKVKYLLSTNPQIKNLIISYSPLSLIRNKDFMLVKPNTSAVMFSRIYPVVDQHKLRNVPYNKLKYFETFVRYYAIPNFRYVSNYISLRFGIGTPKYPFIGGFNDRRSEEEPNLDIEDFKRRKFKCPDNECITLYDLAYLDSLISLAETRKLNLFVISFPLHPDVIKNIPELYTQNYDVIKESFIHKPFVHYIDLMRKFNSLSYFRDFDHIAPNGAKIISKQVNEEINKFSGSNT